MPSGYTAPIKDGITFEQFILSCARGMGALISMRDEPASAPIPERFEPSDYHTKKLEELRTERDRLNALTPAEAEAEFQKISMEQFKERAKRGREQMDLEKAYKEMRDKVEAWQPPTKDHRGLKEFMLQQIDESVQFDCGNYDLSHITGPSTGEAWLQANKDRVRSDIFYHEAEHEKEVARTNERNLWLRQLRDSIAC